MKAISVIIVNYNGKKYNMNCIDSIWESSIASQIQIIVVDNASSDDSAEILEEKWGGREDFFLIRLKDNYGFSKANNIGIKKAMKEGSQYFLLLNNDTVIDSFLIEEMIGLSNKKSGIIVPRIYYYDKPDTLWFAGGKLSKVIKKPKQIGLNEIDKGQFDKTRECEFANGCCMLLTSKIIEQVGYLDERFFLYYEDTEYSMRAKGKKIKIWYCAEAKLYHKVNGATGGNLNPLCSYYITRNWLLYCKMCMGKKIILFYLYFLLNRCAWYLIWFFKGQKECISMSIQGIKDYKKEKWGKYKKI